MSFRFLVATVALVGMLPSAAPALAEMSTEEIAKAVSEAYGVTVLRVVAAEDDGRPVYLVTFMNPGGDFNEAYLVSTIVVDAETGKKVPQFQHGPSGYRLPGAPVHGVDRRGSDAARKGVAWR